MINAFEFGGAGSAILAPVFKIGKELDTQVHIHVLILLIYDVGHFSRISFFHQEFQTKIVPCIVKLFSSNDRNAR